METIRDRLEMPGNHLYASEQTRLLSELQRQLRKNIQAAHDPDAAVILRSRRRVVLRRPHRQLKEDAVAYWNDKEQRYK